MLVSAMCVTKDFITNPTTAELLVAQKVVGLSLQFGWQKLVLEEDALEIVNILKQEEQWLENYANILLDARQKLSTCWDWKIQHIHR